MIHDRFSLAALEFVREFTGKNIEDLLPGYQSDCSFCPVARTVTQNLDTGLSSEEEVSTEVEVSRDEIFILSIEKTEDIGWGVLYSEYRESEELPLDVQHFITRFDEGYYPELILSKKD